jgi:hypothetical protein
MNAERLADRKAMIERSRRLNENAARARRMDRDGVIDTFEDLLNRSSNAFFTDTLRDAEDVARFIGRNR